MGARTPVPFAVLILGAASLVGCGYSGPMLGDLAGNATNQAAAVPQQHLLIPRGYSAKTLSITPANAQVPVGQAFRFGISLVITDGKGHDQTLTDPGYCMWAVSDPTVGTIDDGGLFTPAMPRMTGITASVQNLTATADIDILPAVYNWQQVPSPTDNDLFGIKLVSDQEAWAVGSGGTVLHWINQFWQNESNWVMPGATMRGVDFANGTGWMVGFTGSPQNPGSPVVYNYSYGRWNYQPTDASGGLFAVSAVAQNDAWAVGTTGDGKVLIEHWNGSSWNHDASVGDISGHLNAITMLGGAQGWAVGETGDSPLILHYDGTRWSQQSLPPFTGTFTAYDLKGIAMVDGTHGWAVGTKTNTLGWNYGCVFRYDASGGYTWPVVGSFWHEVSAASGQTPYLDQVPLNAIGMLNGQQGWILGSTIQPRRILSPGAALNDVYGNLLSFDGINYQLETDYFHNNLSQDFLGISLLSSGQGFVVGRQGYIMERAYDWRRNPSGNMDVMPGATDSTVPNNP